MHVDNLCHFRVIVCGALEMPSVGLLESVQNWSHVEADCERIDPLYELAYLDERLGPIFDLVSLFVTPHCYDEGCYTFDM